MLTGRLLVTGPLRSGTTMIASDIATRVLQVTPKPEISPLSDVLALSAKWRKNYDPPRYEAWIRDDSLPNAHADWCLEQLMPASSEQAWQIGKDPELVRFPDELERMSASGTKILLCVRDPLDVMASALDVQRRQSHGHSRRTYIDAVQVAYQGLLRLLSYADSSSQYYVVRYEEYVRDAPEHWQLIADWLGVPFANLQDSDFNRAVDTTDPYFTPLLYMAPTDKQVGAWKTRLRPHERRYLANVFSGVRASLDYEPASTNACLARLGSRSFR